VNPAPTSRTSIAAGDADQIVTPRARLLAALLLIGMLGLFAYRGLIGWEPSGAAHNEVQGTEELLFDPGGGSPLLVYGVSAWLLWRRRSRLLASLGAPPGRVAALCLLPGAAALALWAHYVQTPGLLVLSLVLLLPGAGALLGGREGLRACLLPALFLLFAVEIPPAALHEIMFPLQLATASLTHTLLGLLGIASRLEADQIHSGQQIFQVIESCSGLRLMQTLVMAAVVYAELLSRSRRHTWLLVLVAPVIGVAINALRVLTIVLNPYSDFAAVHVTQGLVMLVVGVFVLAGADRLLDGLLRPPPPGPEGPDPFPGATLAPRRLAALSALLAGLALATLAPTWTAPPPTHRTLSDIPLRLGAWRSESLEVDRSFLGSVRFSERAWRRYRSDGGDLSAFVGIDSRLDPAVSFLSAKTELPGSGWRVVERGPADLPGVDAELLLVRSRLGEQLQLHWYEGVERPATEALRSLLALDRGPWRRQGVARVVRLATPIGRQSSRAEAEARLRAFAPLLRDTLAALERGERPRPPPPPGGRDAAAGGT
jgi:exosortase